MTLPLTALAMTAAVPAAALSVPESGPALPRPDPDRDEDRARALQCLGIAIAYEAGYEPVEGQQAVAEVILNRARSGTFPRTVCGVVFAGSGRRTGCQFTFTCDGSLRRRLPAAVLAGATAVAQAALDGRNPARVAGAAWYHASYVSPYWAPSLVRVARIGAHIFYRAPGAGDPAPGASAYRPVGEPRIEALAGRGGPPAGLPGGAAPAAPTPPQAFAPWGLSVAPRG